MVIISERFKKARCDHICNWCGDAIRSKERYHDAFIKNDGDVYHWKSCARCKFIADELHDYIYDAWDNVADAQSFEDGIQNFLHDHVCKDCLNYEYSHWGSCCSLDRSGTECLDIVGEVLLHNQLVYELQDPACPHDCVRNPRIYKLVPRKPNLTKFPDGGTYDR